MTTGTAIDCDVQSVSHLFKRRIIQRLRILVFL
jgi:hypothetical protein